MNVNAVGFGMPSMEGGSFFGGGSDVRLKALEQKLLQLNQEKEKAIRNKDEEKVKKIEQQIENVRRQIEQLKRKKQQKEKVQKSENPRETEQSGGLYTAAQRTTGL